MIICHQYKYIFIKTNKTAGTSIEIALSKFCGPDDVITPVTPEDEETRRTLGYRGPQHYLAAFPDYRIGDWTRFLLTGTRKKKFYNHISAREIRQHVGPETWENYFKFCFERNPWDRLISLYYWHYKSEPRPSISKFLQSHVPQSLKHRGRDLYTIDGQIAVDKICRFEHLAEDLESIRVHLGIPEPLELPRAKSRFRRNPQSYREIFDEEQRLKVAELFAEEIKSMGYDY